MRRLSRWVSMAAFIVVAVISVLAVIDNRSLVALRFLGWSTPELSVYWWLVAAFVLGVIVGSARCRRARLARQRRQSTSAA